MAGSTFARFPARLQEAIVARLGWTSLRPVQEEAGAAILDGKNAVVLAPTAGGKTEAAMFPVLADLVDRPPAAVGAVYVAPIKALLNNQEERLATYAEMVGLSSFVWHGDVTAAAKKRFRSEPGALLLTTPESLEVMLLSEQVPAATLFADLRAVVVDEVHAFAGTDRGAHLISVIERIARLSRHDIQRVGLSATVGNPEAILDWLSGSSTRKRVVVHPTVPPAKREVVIAYREAVADLAREAGRDAKGKKSLFFCQSRALSETVAERLRGSGTEVFVHHSCLALEERREAEARFARGSDACIVCTSTLELGIDVGDLDLVFQANAPSTVSSFLQRMGRTGRRAGKKANTTFLCDDEDAVLQAIAIVEFVRDGWIEPVPVEMRCFPVLVHQILALCLEHGAIAREPLFAHLVRVPDFQGITAVEIERLLAHLLETHYLFETEGRLSMGEAAERAFGRQNFREIYAVFSSPTLYRVETASGTDLGSLEQAFVDRLVEEMSSFLLAGRAWAVERIIHTDRVVRVQPAPRGSRPTWGGFVPQLLGFDLCRRIRAVIAGDDRFPYLDPAAEQVLDARRAALGALLRGPEPTFQSDDGALRWWTFAGGRVNHTLKFALQWIGGWRVVVDNVALRLEGEGGAAGPSIQELTDAIRTMGTEGFWSAEATQGALRERLPGYRLSKFQRCLPASLSAETVGRFLLDVLATRAFVGACLGSQPRPIE